MSRSQKGNNISVPRKAVMSARSLRSSHADAVTELRESTPDYLPYHPGAENADAHEMQSMNGAFELWRGGASIGL